MDQKFSTEQIKVQIKFTPELWLTHSSTLICFKCLHCTSCWMLFCLLERKNLQPSLTGFACIVIHPCSQFCKFIFLATQKTSQECDAVTIFLYESSVQSNAKCFYANHKLDFWVYLNKAPSLTCLLCPENLLEKTRLIEDLFGTVDLFLPFPRWQTVGLSTNSYLCI